MKSEVVERKEPTVMLVWLENWDVRDLRLNARMPTAKNDFI